MQKEIGLAVVITTYFSMLYVFLGAYLAPAKFTVVPCNWYGEADFELVMFILTFPFVVKYFWDELKLGRSGEHQLP